MLTVSTRFVLASVSVFALSGCAMLPELPARTDNSLLTNIQGRAFRWTEELEALGPYRKLTEPHSDVLSLFDDDALRSLISMAMGNNASLVQMEERLREARASLALTRAGARPHLSLGGSASAMRLSENGQIPAGSIPGFPTEQTLFSTGFDANWEIDVFGRQGIREDAALAQLSLQEELYDDVKLSLSAELARAWYELQSVRAERALLQESLSRQQDIVDMVATRREFGEASDVDMERARFRRLQTDLESPSLDMRERLARNQIAILIGTPPAGLHADDTPTTGLPDADQPLLILTASDVLARRPDVRAAERQYVILARQLDLARLEVFPTFSLFGSAGPEARDLADILSPESLALSLGAIASWTLWDGGRQDAREEVIDAQLAQAALGYHQAVVTAVGEVENAAARYGETLRLTHQLEVLLESAERLTAYAVERYEGGTGTLLQVTEAERDQIDVQRQLTSARRDAIFALIALYKAMGGPA